MTSEQWNKQFPIGTPVRYWAGFKSGEGTLSRTRSPAWDVCGTPCVSVVGKAGGIALTHVEPDVAEVRFTLTPEALAAEGIAAP